MNVPENDYVYTTGERVLKRIAIRNVKSMKGQKPRVCDAIRLGDGKVYLQFKNVRRGDVETIALDDVIEQIEDQL